MKVKDAKHEITVRLDRAKFNEACYDALRRAASLFGIDDAGHSNLIEDFARSTDNIIVKFDGYEAEMCTMRGSVHIYHFTATIRRYDSDGNVVIFDDKE